MLLLGVMGCEWLDNMIVLIELRNYLVKRDVNRQSVIYIFLRLFPPLSLTSYIYIYISKA